MMSQTMVRQSEGHTRRRLSDRIEDAFEQACEQGQLEVASCLLQGLDLALLGRPTPWNRRQAALGLLRASHDRLERLRAAVGVEQCVQGGALASAALAPG